MAFKMAPRRPQNPHRAPQDPPDPPWTPSRTPGDPQEPSGTSQIGPYKIGLSLLLSCRRTKGTTSIEVADHMLQSLNLHMHPTSSNTVDHKLDGGGGVRARRILDKSNLRHNVYAELHMRICCVGMYKQRNRWGHMQPIEYRCRPSR